MLISKKIKIKINTTALKHYIKKGYNVRVGDEIIVNVNDLTPSSTYKVKVKCDICGNEKELTYNKYIKNIKKYNLYTCSNKCSSIKNKKTNLEKYGSENYSNREKYKKTCLEKYGVENSFQILDTKEKIKKTNIKKYGVESANSSDIVKNNKKKSLLKKYGVDSYSKTNEYKEKMKLYNQNKEYKNQKLKTFTNTCIEKYGVSHTSNMPEIRKKIKNSNQNTYQNKIIDNNILIVDFDRKGYICKCDYCKNNFFINYSILKNRKKSKTVICTICNPIQQQTSGMEIQLQHFIKENYDTEILINKRNIIYPYELDIYLPELKLAFEFNGLWWHNELNKENNYHLNKTEKCEKQGIQLIHIYEDDWIYKQEIVKSFILNKLNKTSNKIYARNCEIKEINDNNLIKEFLDKNHIQGFIGSKIKLGLFYNNELISLMTFGNRRIAMGKKLTNENEYELLRFCNELNTNAIGGASKLFKYFIETYKPKEITTYADRSFSQGDLYKQLGFEFKGNTEPNYFYIIDGVRHHRFNFRKDKLVKEGFDFNKTEHEIMLEKNIYRIYDSGNLKFNYVRRK
jgi:very-short-patch-repair endonuclease